MTRNLILLLILCSYISCRENTSASSMSNAITTTEYSIYEAEDEVPPPPPGQLPVLKSIPEWLESITNGEKPGEKITLYETGLFKGDTNYTLYFAGFTTKTEKDTLYKLITFQPNEMYIDLPEEYNQAGKENMDTKIISEFKSFCNRDIFKNSFLANAEKIVFADNGQIIWKK